MGSFLSTYSEQSTCEEPASSPSEIEVQKITVIDDYFGEQAKEMNFEIVKSDLPSPQKVPEPENMPQIKRVQRTEPIERNGFHVIDTKRHSHHVANLFVRLPTGTTVVYNDFFNSDTVGDLATRIYKKHGCSVNTFCLSHRGNIMDVMQKQLMEYDIDHNSTVEVQIKKSIVDKAYKNIVYKA